MSCYTSFDMESSDKLRIEEESVRVVFVSSSALGLLARTSDTDYGPFVSLM